MAELAAARCEDMASPFTCAHLALTLAAVFDRDGCERLLGAMRNYAEARDHTLARSVRAALPAARAAILHRRGEHAAVIETLWPARTDLWRMGGSHAQREVFQQLLFDSARRLGRDELMTTLRREIEGQGFVETAERVAYDTSRRSSRSAPRASKSISPP